MYNEFIICFIDGGNVQPKHNICFISVFIYLNNFDEHLSIIVQWLNYL